MASVWQQELLLGEARQSIVSLIQEKERLAKANKESDDGQDGQTDKAAAGQSASKPTALYATCLHMACPYVYVYVKTRPCTAST